MYQRVKIYVETHHMLQENDHVITGVSGGADSVCLLFMLKELKKEMPLELTAVHIHHGLTMTGEEQLSWTKFPNKHRLCIVISLCYPLLNTFR